METESANRTESATRVAPPYIPYKTFANFIEEMRERGLPHQIDRSVMQKMSGIMQKQVLQALRFLGLTNESGEVTSLMHELVAADTEQAKSVLGKIIKSAYAEVIGAVNIETATMKQLTDRFRDDGKIDGDTLLKATRFYLKSLDASGIRYSGHLKLRQSRAPSSKRTSAQGTREKSSTSERIKEKGEAEDPKVHTPSEHKPPDGMLQVPLYFPSGTGYVVVPQSLSEEDCEMIDAILRAIAKRRNQSKQQ